MTGAGHCSAKLLFAYGTLQEPSILRTLVGCRLRGEPAELADYRRVALGGEPYPGIVWTKGGSVSGILYRLNPAMLRRLDAYEGNAYRRRRLTVRTAKGKVHAEVYVLRRGWHAAVSGRPWDLEIFRRRALKRCLASLRDKH